MKRWMLCGVGIFMIFALSGCGNNATLKSGATANAVDAVLKEQTASQEEKSKEEDVAEPDSKEPDSKEPEKADKSVDIDLTQMSSDMVYATVYQLLNQPEEYVGKQIKMKGNYYASWYVPTKQYYHYAIIQDATACCSQGLEFVWGDGSHKYPDEYPKEGAEVTVTGTFQTYKEAKDDTVYCRLVQSKVKF